MTHPQPTNEFIPFGREWIDRSIKDRFEHVVRSYPQNVALLEGGRAITYEELNGQANRLAHALLDRLGDGEVAVSVLLGHGSAAILALLGVLKAGKVCVPMDPSLPQSRAAQIAQDAEAAMFITRADYRSQALALCRGEELIEVDRLPGGLSERNPQLDIPPERIAYVLYTSGSSGGPKGVMFSQRTLLHPVLVQTNSLHSNSTDRFSLLTSVGVGMAVIHLYGSILNGGTLCPFVVAGGGLLEMIDWMREQKISVLQSTPSLFRRLAAEPNSEAGFASLRLLKLSGEMVLRSDFDLYRRTCPPDCLLRVGYSTTEAGVVTEDLLDRNSQVLAEQLPAGYPVSDVEIRLCNEVGEPVAEGEGEIVVRSRYVSPGYWRRPDLTQAAFSEDPSGKGRRSFRTGDQGHLLGDGCLVLRGRKDSQVKVRGYRVELSEVEQALLRMKGIQEAAAGTWERNLGEEVLVAYVVAGAQPPPRPAELRSALRQSLPDAMIPSAFVFLESMPLTESGKIDRQALPAPLPAPAHFDGQPPNSLLEAQLCHIWEEVLGVRPVGIQDDFFDLGGTSLQALQLFERIRQQLGQRIPLEVILRASTVEQQAEVLLAPGGTDLPATLVPLQPAGSRPPFFFIHPARGHVLCYRLLAHWLSADQPVYGIQAQGVRPEQKPHTSIEDIAAGHLNSVRNFQPKGPYFLGGYSLGGVIAFEMARQLAAQGEQVALLALLDTPCPARKIRRRTLRQRLQRRAAQLRRRTLRGKAAFLWGLLRRSLPAHLWHLEEVHWAAAQRYRPGPYAGKVLLLRAQGRRDHIDGDPSLGWSEWVTGPLEVAEVPGNHISLLQEPNVRRLAEVLRHHLAETLEKEQGPSGHDRRPAG